MFNGIGDREKRRILIAFLYAGVAILVYLVMRYMLYLAAPFVIALLIACAVDKPVSWLNRQLKIPRAAGGFIVIITIILIAGSGILYVGYFAISELKAFLANYGNYADMVSRETLFLCERIDVGLGLAKGSSYNFVDENVTSLMTKVAEWIASFVLGHSVSVTKRFFVWAAAVFIAVTAAVFIIHDFEKVRRIYKEGVYAGELNLCFGKMLRFGVVFIRTQLVIMAITMTVCTVGLIFIKNPYALLLGILIGLMDALPVLGTGTVLVPWTIIYLISGNFFKGAVIFSMYLICYTLREVLEPRMMGSNLGIHPVLMLMSMYAGVMLFGISGFVLGPAAYIIITEIMGYIKKVL